MTSYQGHLSLLNTTTGLHTSCQMVFSLGDNAISLFPNRTNELVRSLHDSYIATQQTSQWCGSWHQWLTHKGWWTCRPMPRFLAGVVDHTPCVCLASQPSKYIPKGRMKPHVDCLQESWNVTNCYINCNTTDKKIKTLIEWVSAAFQIAYQLNYRFSCGFSNTSHRLSGQQGSERRNRLQLPFFPFPFRNAAKIVNGNYKRAKSARAT